jgi:hypothetical protein
MASPTLLMLTQSWRGSHVVLALVWTLVRVTFVRLGSKTHCISFVSFAQGDQPAKQKDETSFVNYMDASKSYDKAREPLGCQVRLIWICSWEFERIFSRADDLMVAQTPKNTQWVYFAVCFEFIYFRLREPVEYRLVFASMHCVRWYEIWASALCRHV